MKLNELFTDDRAVSPVVGVALLIAITVILAAVIGGVVLGLGTGGADTPQAQLNAEFPTDNDVEIHHNGGEPLEDGDVYVVVNDGNPMSLSEMGGVGDGEALTAGNSASHNDAETIDTVTVLWEDPSSDSTTVLARFSS